MKKSRPQAGGWQAVSFNGGGNQHIGLNAVNGPEEGASCEIISLMMGLQSARIGRYHQDIMIKAFTDYQGAITNNHKTDKKWVAYYRRNLVNNVGDRMTPMMVALVKDELNREWVDVDWNVRIAYAGLCMVKGVRPRGAKNNARTKMTARKSLGGRAPGKQVDGKWPKEKHKGLLTTPIRRIQQPKSKFAPLRTHLRNQNVLGQPLNNSETTELLAAIRRSSSEQESQSESQSESQTEYELESEDESESERSSVRQLKQSIRDLEKDAKRYEAWNNTEWNNHEARRDEERGKDEEYGGYMCYNYKDGDIEVDKEVVKYIGGPLEVDNNNALLSYADMNRRQKSLYATRKEAALTVARGGPPAGIKSYQRGMSKQASTTPCRDESFGDNNNKKRKANQWGNITKFIRKWSNEKKDTNKRACRKKRLGDNDMERNKNRNYINKNRNKRRTHVAKGRNNRNKNRNKPVKNKAAPVNLISDDEVEIISYTSAKRTSAVTPQKRPFAMSGIPALETIPPKKPKR